MSGNGNNSSGTMILLLVVGGACCLSLLCSGGGLMAYNFNAEFKKWVDGLFKTGDSGDSGGGGGSTISSAAGQWVCPTSEWNMNTVNGVRWCQHPQSGDTSITDEIIRNHHRASKLPSGAIAGQRYEPNDLTSKDGQDGVYGPEAGGYGKTDDQKKLMYYIAP